MKFFGRASIFFVLFGLILIFLGYTVTSFTSSLSEKDRKYSGKRKNAEREYTVFTDVIKKSEETPVIYAYGEVKSWRTLEIRAPVVGKISEVAEAEARHELPLKWLHRVELRNITFLIG